MVISNSKIRYAIYYRKHRIKILQAYKEYYANNPEYKKRQIERANAQSHTLAYKARLKIRFAIYSKKIKRQSCEVCGDPKTHAHHNDYSKPFQVRWLCSTHHGMLHRKYSDKELKKLSTKK